MLLNVWNVFALTHEREFPEAALNGIPHRMTTLQTLADLTQVRASVDLSMLDSRFEFTREPEPHRGVAGSF